MATKKGGKKAAKKGGQEGSKEGRKEGSQEEIVRTGTFQQQPSTGAHKLLRPAWPFKRNDEHFKRNSSFLLYFELASLINIDQFDAAVADFRTTFSWSIRQ